MGLYMPGKLFFRFGCFEIVLFRLVCCFVFVFGFDMCFVFVCVTCCVFSCFGEFSFMVIVVFVLFFL